MSDIEVNGHRFYSPYFGEWACRVCGYGYAGGDPSADMAVHPCERPERLELRGKAWLEGSLEADGPHRWAFTTIDDVTLLGTYEARLVIVRDKSDE